MQQADVLPQNQREIVFISITCLVKECSIFRDCMALTRDLFVVGFLVSHAYLIGYASLVCIDMVLTTTGGLFISFDTLLALFFSVGMVLYH